MFWEIRTAYFERVVLIAQKKETTEMWSLSLLTPARVIK